MLALGLCRRLYYGYLLQHILPRAMGQLALFSCKPCLSVFDKAYPFVSDKGSTFVLACDEGYAFPTTVAIQSLKNTNSSEKRVIVFNDGVPSESMNRLVALADGVIPFM
jgi:hypothetical protein